MTYKISNHAKDRIRQRMGIESTTVMGSWIAEKMKHAEFKCNDDHKKHYAVDGMVIVLDGDKVVTLMPDDAANTYVAQLGEMIAKEARKLLTKARRDYRKAEIEVAEITLNFLKARNPRTKAVINEKLTAAIDKREQINDELTQIKKSAKHYNVELGE